MPIEIYVTGIIISCIALVVSIITAWFSFFKTGRLKMTQPVLIFFGSDLSSFKGAKTKIFLRTLLYSTSKQGNVIESLYISLKRNETSQNFNIWQYGERGNLQIGSGLFVPKEGVSFDHHFVLPEDGSEFLYLAGTYQLSVYANLAGGDVSEELFDVTLDVSESQAEEHKKGGVFSGIFFSWLPERRTYSLHVDAKPDPANILKEMANKKIQATQKART